MLENVFLFLTLLFMATGSLNVPNVHKVFKVYNVAHVSLKIDLVSLIVWKALIPEP